MTATRQSRPEAAAEAVPGDARRGRAGLLRLLYDSGDAGEPSPRHRAAPAGGRSHPQSSRVASVEESGAPPDLKRRAADGLLMEAVAAGDQAAFARLMAEQSPRLLRFVSALLGSVADAEELVQEALIRLWRQAEDWRPDGLVSTWLHRVAYRLAIDAIRRRKISVGLEGLEDVLPDDSLPHDERLVRDEESRRLSRAIDALPERQRTALLLCHFQELSQAEAAAVMGIGEHAYESLLARARRKLRGMMTGEPDSRGEGHDV